MESRKAVKDPAAGILHERRVCRRRCAQWWKSTSPNIKKMQPGVEERGHRAAEDDDEGSRITQVGVEGRGIKTAEDDSDG
jgi:hypothetical protein